ncbi:UNVERIFIED_CONTAM: hypothetical protein FKN15_072632 [Acipenser sinensis]
MKKMERQRQKLGLAPLIIQEREPTELELLLQNWEQAREASLTPEPEGVELLSQEPEGVELLSREPKGVELPSRDPKGVVLPSREPEGMELLSRARWGGATVPRARGGGATVPRARGGGAAVPTARGVEPWLSQEPLAENKGEEVKKIPPPQPQPPLLKTSPVLLGTVPCPLLMDTLPVCPDLPALDLEARSLHIGHKSTPGSLLHSP